MKCFCRNRELKTRNKDNLFQVSYIILLKSDLCLLTKIILNIYGHFQCQIINKFGLYCFLFCQILTHQYKSSVLMPKLVKLLSVIFNFHPLPQTTSPHPPKCNNLKPLNCKNPQSVTNPTETLSLLSNEVYIQPFKQSLCFQNKIQNITFDPPPLISQQFKNEQKENNNQSNE